MISKIVRISLSTMFAGVLFLFFAEAVSAQPQRERHAPGMGMMHAVDSEFEFLVEMIPHHQEAVDTAGDLVRRTGRQELRDFGASIIEVQNREIAMMRKWLADWYSDRNTETFYRPMMRPTAGLSPDRADQVFLEDMIMHHRMAVMMANFLIRRRLTDRPEVLTFAEGIIRTQNTEIEQMEKWLFEWYGVQPGGRGRMMH